MKLKIVRKGKTQQVDIDKLSLQAHEASRGKIEIIGKVPILSLEDLALYYTPGVGAVSLAIHADKDLSYKYTSRGNTIAILTNGTRVLGLGGVGPEAGMPVMEGKALLFKKFGGVNAVPLCVNAHSAAELIAVARAIEPSVGGINLEDIAPPLCFEVFDALQKDMNIPVFHDDRHGTAVVTLAALRNALKLVGKDIVTSKIVINGIGAAGVGIAQLFISKGAENLTMCDTRGALYRGRTENMSPVKESLAQYTNKAGIKGQLEDVVKGADVLIGASNRGVFTERMIKSMAPNPIVFALANPEPEIDYYRAKASGAEIVATGVSDMPNQVNNLLAFPAIFRGAMEAHARKINTAMLLAASDVLAESIHKKKLSVEHIIPNFEEDDVDLITADMAAEVARVATQTGVYRKKVTPEEVRANVLSSLKRYSKIEKAMVKLDKTKRLKRFLKLK